MTDQGDLAEALGMVAMADAEVDEWVVMAFAAALAPMGIALVRLLVAGDSLGAKVKKLKGLLRARNYECSEVGAQHPPVAEIAARTNKLKDYRDTAVHSFYGPAEGDRYTRFRSRRNESDDTTLQALREYARELRANADEWAAVVRQLEHQNAAAGAFGSEANGLLEDCRELVATSRVTDPEKLEALQSGGDLTIALGGQGRWRLSEPDELLGDNEHRATLSLATGRISIVMADGTTIEGGDTGWRDVTQLAAEENAEVEGALLRRVHGQVLYVQHGGVLQVERVQDSLARRIFGSTDEVSPPSFLADLEGFRPPPS